MKIYSLRRTQQLFEMSTVWFPEPSRFWTQICLFYQFVHSFKNFFEAAYIHGISSFNFLLSEFKYYQSHLEFKYTAPSKSHLLFVLAQSGINLTSLDCSAFEVPALMFPSALFSLISNLKPCQINVTCSHIPAPHFGNSAKLQSGSFVF